MAIKIAGMVHPKIKEYFENIKDIGFKYFVTSIVGNREFNDYMEFYNFVDDYIQNDVPIKDDISAAEYLLKYDPSFRDSIIFCIEEEIEFMDISSVLLANIHVRVKREQAFDDLDNYVNGYR